MAKEILFQAQQQSVSISQIIIALVLGAIGVFVVSPLGGFILFLFSVAYFFLSHWRKYRQTLANPIRLDFEGIHYNLVSQELGGDCLPWDAVSKISELVRSNGKKKIVRIDLSPGLYYENWRELKISNRTLDPGYQIDADLYDVDHEGMLYQFKAFHQKHGLGNVDYAQSKTTDQDLNAEVEGNTGDEPSNLRLIVSAIFGYLVILYAELSGRFPLGVNNSLSVDSSPLLFSFMEMSFFLIASWAMSKVYVRHNISNASVKEGSSRLTTKGLNIAGIMTIPCIYLMEFVFGLALTNYYMSSGLSLEEAVEHLSNADLFEGAGIILLLGIFLFSGSAGLILAVYRADSRNYDCIFLLLLCCVYWVTVYFPTSDYADSVSNILIRSLPIIVGYFGWVFLIRNRDTQIQDPPTDGSS